jgi:hypothetical protein
MKLKQNILEYLDICNAVSMMFQFILVFQQKSFRNRMGHFSLVEGVNKLGKAYNLIVAKVYSMVQQYIAFLLLWQPEEIAPYFCLYLLQRQTHFVPIMVLRMKFPTFCVFIIIFCDTLHEVDRCLKCTFFHLTTL